jgi:hypothetical protein
VMDFDHPTPADLANSRASSLEEQVAYLRGLTRGMGDRLEFMEATQKETARTIQSIVTRIKELEERLALLGSFRPTRY